jgi:peptide-methionine (S)-S-oxide reductase
MNRQGNDSGTQYASVVFVHDEEQRRIATKVKAELQAHLDAGRLKASTYDGKVVSTAIVGAMPFYKAKSSHQDYLQNNPGGYCNHRIRFKTWPSSPEL